MNSEVGKWIEIWLDSAGERVYQPAFLTALVHDGYSILHNTSHNSLELGKDIICRDNAGRLFAMQLKGNPGSRLTMSQWHDLYEQVIQLVSAPVSLSISGGKTAEIHTPILVTNGEIQEDVRAAVDSFNSAKVPTMPGAQPLQLWARGQLLNLFTKASSVAWPSNINAQIGLLRSTSVNGLNVIDLEEVHNIAIEALDWRGGKPSNARSLSLISSLATITNIMSAPQYLVGNYYEAIKLKTIMLINIMCYLDKNKCNTKKHLNVVSLIRNQLFGLINWYCCEVSKKNKGGQIVNNDIFSEFAIMHSRRIQVAALAAVDCLERGSSANQGSLLLATRRLDYPFLSSEALIPCFLAVFWAKDSFEGTQTSAYELMRVARTIIRQAKSGFLVSSYYSLEEVLRYHFREYLGTSRHVIARDQRVNMSQFSYALVLLLGRRNWKQTCKSLWPDLTRVHRMETVLYDSVEVGFPRTDNCIEQATITKIPVTWAQLIEIMTTESAPNLPPSLLDDPVVCLLLCIFLPHRMTEDMILWLDRKLSHTWY